MRNNHLHQVGTPPPASGEEASTPGIRTSHFYRGTPLPPVVGNIPGRVVQQQGNSSSSRPTATDPEHGDGAGGWDDESTILSSDDGGGATSAEHNHLPQQPPSQSGQQQGASTSTAAFSGGESGGGYSHEPLFASFRPESAESTDTSTADNVSGRGSYFRGSALGVDNLSFSGMRTPDTVSMGGRSSSHRGLSAHGGAKFGAGRTVVIPWYRNTKFWVWFVSILAAIHIILFWLVVGVVLSKSDLLFEGDSSVNTLSVTGAKPMCSNSPHLWFLCTLSPVFLPLCVCVCLHPPAPLFGKCNRVSTVSHLLCPLSCCLRECIVPAGGSNIWLSVHILIAGVRTGWNDPVVSLRGGNNPLNIFRDVRNTLFLVLFQPRGTVLWKFQCTVP